MDPQDEPDRPPSLDLTDLGPDRFRGQLRPARDDTKIRRLFWSGLAAICLLMIGVNLAQPLWSGIASALGFLVLVFTAYNLTGVINLPLTIHLDATALEMGEERIPLSEIERIEATDGPPKIVLVRTDGSREVWIASDEHHNVDDLAWLAETVTERLPR